MSKIHELAFNAEEIDELLDSVDKKTIYQDATQSEHGLMSATDKTKLDALPTAQQIDGALNAKVDKVEGKGLSKNDYTDEDKAKVASALQTETDPTVPSWAKQSTKPSYDYSEISNTPDLSGFITKSVNDLTNYYLKSETYTKAEVAALIGAIQQFHYEIYSTLPQTGQGNVLYLIGPTGSGTDRYEEYVYSNNAFTKIGDTSIDLSGYVTTSALNTALADYTTTANLTTLLSNKADKVSNATNGNFAGLDANGNLNDSGKNASDFATASQGAKADTAYQKPQAGIPESDLSHDVQQALQKHFKGWYDSSSNLPANPVVGDYAYVKGASSTDPAAIYECTTDGSWTDSGRTADTSNVQTFATGEKVNETPIDNTHIANPKDGALPTAADVMQLKAKLERVTASETKASYVAVDGYKVQGTGTLSSNVNCKYTTIPLNNAKGVRFLGVNLSSNSSATSKNTGYCFGHYNGEEIEENWVIDTHYAYEATAADLNVGKEYIAIPTSISTHFRTNVKYGSYLPEEDFYCYLQNGDSVLDVINDEIEVLKEDDDITRSNLSWQLCPFEIVSYLYPKENNNTFTTISVSFPIWFKKVVKDELVKIECVRECKMYLSDSLPADGVLYTYITIPEGVTIYRCTSDGYISFSSYSFLSERYASSVYLYTIAPNIDDCIKHKINVTLRRREGIDTRIGSDTYGTVIYVNSIDWGLSPIIDVSGYNYIGVNVYYSTSSISLNGVGGMFFNENYVAGENDAQCIVGDPIGVTRNTANKNGISFFKVPDGAKYFRAFGNLNSIVIYGLDRNETAINPDEITEIVEDAVENFSKQEAVTISPKTIFELNNDTEMFAKMVIAKKKFNSGGSNPGTIIPLVLAHVSDAHGAATQYQRYIEFANHWKLNGYIDELIDTGDVVASVYNDGLAWRNAIEGVGDILTVVGNHDTRCDAAEQEAASLTLYDIWQYHGAVSVDPSKRTDVYSLLLAGKVNNWGVTQPSNAAANGLCYYYKDYESQGIRLIGLDVMGYDQDQQDWLEARLAESLTLTYHVVIIAHFTGTPMTPLICNYTSLRLTGSTFHPYMSRYLEETNPDAIAEAVDTFQTNGGNFIGYITGHYHRDMINVVTGYPKQLVFVVDSGGVTTTRDFTKIVGCKSYDDFQVISINTEDKTVKLIKVGADTDYYMRKKGTVSVGYTLVKDDGTEPSSGESATKVKGIIGEGF